MPSFCAGRKRERRLKQTFGDSDDAEDDEEDENDSAEADSSDPMMGFTFNECKLAACVFTAVFQLNMDDGITVPSPHQFSSSTFSDRKPLLISGFFMGRMPSMLSKHRKKHRNTNPNHWPGIDF